ncbi:MAG TPA: CdaR family protein [Kofleriaceae bacterium]|nr:CdaR family protein [Kofleriaceae bacterium]
MRPRSQTFGGLGRTPRSSRMAAATPPKEPPAERGAVRRWIHGALFDNIGLKFLSLVLAVTVFLVVNTDKEREIRVHVPIEYKYPADKVMTSEPPTETTVTIKGPWRRLRAFDERELDRITLDLSAMPTGDFTDVAIRKELINLPPGLSVVSINPNVVRVGFDKRVEKTVEVVAVIAGRPQHGYIVAEQKVVPATVKVRGGERMLAALTQVRTHEVGVQNRSESFDTQIDLAPPAGVEAEPGQRVTVYVRIEEELVTRRLPRIPVAVRGEGVDPARWSVEPAHLEVTLTGALLAVEKAKDKLAAYVKVTPADVRPREAEVMIEGIPPGVGKRISPERVKVVPVKGERGIP